MHNDGHAVDLSWSGISYKSNYNFASYREKQFLQHFFNKLFNKVQIAPKLHKIQCSSFICKCLDLMLSCDRKLNRIRCEIREQLQIQISVLTLFCTIILLFRPQADQVSSFAVNHVLTTELHGFPTKTCKVLAWNWAFGHQIHCAGQKI